MLSWGKLNRRDVGRRPIADKSVKVEFLRVLMVLQTGRAFVYTFVCLFIYRVTVLQPMGLASPRVLLPLPPKFWYYRNELSHHMRLLMHLGPSRPH